MRPDNSEEESPSTTCRPSAVNATGGSVLGRGPPGFGKSPGILPCRQTPPPPPPPPPPPAPVPHGHAMATATTNPRERTPLHTRPKASGKGGPPDGPGGGTGAGVGDYSNPSNNAAPSEGNNPGKAQPPGGGNPGDNPGGSSTPPGFTLIHAAYLQLNGETHMPETEKKIVNCLWLFAQKPFDPPHHPKPPQTPNFPKIRRYLPGIPTQFILSAVQNPTEFH